MAAANPQTNVTSFSHIDMSELHDEKFLKSVGKDGCLGLVEYTSENKGVPKSELEKGSPCSLHFLRCIKYNLQFIAHDWMLKTDVSEDKSKDDKALEEFADCFQKTTVEYHRLNKHPELFESKEVRTAFHHDALMIIKYLKHKKMPKELIEKLRIEVSLAASLEFERSFLPSADENRKPWQQFLHNNAPGSGIDLSSLAGEGTVQVIPHAAIRLLRGYRKDMKDMAEKLKKYGVHTPEPQVIKLGEWYPTMSGNRRKILGSSDSMTPVPVAPKGPDGLAVESLESLNQNSSLIDGTPAANPADPTNFRVLIVKEEPSDPFEFEHRPKRPKWL